MAQLSEEMQAILQNTEAAVKVHDVAMTDGYAFVEDLEGRGYVGVPGTCASHRPPNPGPCRGGRNCSVDLQAKFPFRSEFT